MAFFDVIRLSMRVRVVEDELATVQQQLADLNKVVRGIAAAHETLQDEHTKLELAFKTLRSRVYAWRRWEEPEESVKPALDKAAILAAHMAKRGG